MTRTLLAGGCALCLAACATDGRKNIAFQTLFSADGRANQPAIAAALWERFPPGSSIEPLKAYVAALGGTCSERRDAHERCEITMRTKPCVAEMLGLDVSTRSGSIERIEVQIGTLGC